MTAKELAAMLNGREVGEKVHRQPRLEVPRRGSREEAQTDLDRLAEKKGWMEWNG